MRLEYLMHTASRKSVRRSMGAESSIPIPMKSWEYGTRLESTMRIDGEEDVFASISAETCILDVCSVVRPAQITVSKYAMSGYDEEQRVNKCLDLPMQPCTPYKRVHTQASPVSPRRPPSKRNQAQQT